MNLLIVRHGKAGEREDWAQNGMSDNLRPLTDKGIREMEEIAKYLAKKVSTECQVFSSPLVRARQTAEILAEALDSGDVTIIDELKPLASREALLKKVAALDEDRTIVLAGHEPSLSHFISWLVSGLDASILEFKKGAVALLTTEDSVRPGSFVLQWLLQPKNILKD